MQPCVRPVGAVHMTAGHNALRGSGPGQNPAFDNAMAHVGCPDRRIDRLCITCCSPSQPSHHAGCRRELITPQARCVGAHHLSRKLKALGYDARLMPAKYVRPIRRDRRATFVRSSCSKNSSLEKLKWSSRDLRIIGAAAIFRRFSRYLHCLNILEPRPISCVSWLTYFPFSKSLSRVSRGCFCTQDVCTQVLSRTAVRAVRALVKTA